MDPRRNNVVMFIFTMATMHYIMMEVAAMQHIVLVFHYCMVDALDIVVVWKLVWK